jgi:hypothetical protein
MGGCTCELDKRDAGRRCDHQYEHSAHPQRGEFARRRKQPVESAPSRRPFDRIRPFEGQNRINQRVWILDLGFPHTVNLNAGHHDSPETVDRHRQESAAIRR